MLKLALKDLKLFFADKRSMLLTFAMPMALISLFAMAFGGTGSGGSKEYDLLVCDMDSTSSSQNAIAQLDSQKSLHVVYVQLAVAQDLVKKGKNDAVLIFYR